VLTIFQNSRAWVERCTFTGNRNGVDDMSGQGTYRECIFFSNAVEIGQPGQRYEVDLAAGGTVENCFINGRIIDPKNAVSSGKNVLNAKDPAFTADFVPRTAGYEKVGSRPVNRAAQ
jgi:hypothetical protein